VTYGTFDCQNCGRSQERTQRNQKFCPRNPNGTSCKDRYWSRGTRRVSKINIRLNILVDLVEEMIGLVKSNQSRIQEYEEFHNIDKSDRNKNLPRS